MIGFHGIRKFSSEYNSDAWSQGGTQFNFFFKEAAEQVYYEKPILIKMMGTTFCYTVGV